MAKFDCHCCCYLIKSVHICSLLVVAIMPHACVWHRSLFVVTVLLLRPFGLWHVIKTCLSVYSLVSTHMIVEVNGTINIKCF